MCADDRVLVDRDDRAARRARRAEREVAVRRVADRERRERRWTTRHARCDGRRRTRRRSGSSRATGRRRCRGTGSAPSPARVSSAKPCASFEKRVPLAAGQTTASGSSQPSCSAISNEIVFAPSLGIRVEVAADEPPREERAELELEPAAVVVRAVDREDARARVARRDGRRLAADGREHDRLEPGRGCGRGDRVAEVAGRGAAQSRQAVVERGDDRERRDAVLVRAASGSRPRASAADRRRGARKARSERTSGVQPALHVDLRARGQQVVVAPQRGGPAATERAYTRLDRAQS